MPAEPAALRALVDAIQPLPMGGDDPGRAGYLVIADISGYTGFLVQNELDHAQGILAEITQLLIEHLSAPFRFVELEGDAVFVFAPDVAVEDSERLVDILEACYAAFRLRLEQMVVNTSCECSACRTIPDLDLKCVAHFGRYVPQRTPTGTKLVGPDVILVHRLLKNRVVERTGVRAYALLTEAFVREAAFAAEGLGLPRYEEEIPELGPVEGRVLDLAVSLEQRRTTARRHVGPDDADLEIVADLPAGRSEVWGYFLDAKRRHRWQQDTTSVQNQVPENGRSGVGWESHCDHGSYRLDHRIVDWQPFDYVTMETISSGRSLVKPPPGLATFEFEAVGPDACRVHMRLRAYDRGLRGAWAVRLVARLVRREWRGHYAALATLLREDRARADAATG